MKTRKRRIKSQTLRFDYGNGDDHGLDNDYQYEHEMTEDEGSQTADI